MKSKKIRNRITLMFINICICSKLISQTAGGIVINVSMGKFITNELGDGYNLKDYYAYEATFSWKHYWFRRSIINPSIEYQIGFRNKLFEYSNHTNFISEYNNYTNYATIDYFSWNRYSLGVIGNINIGRPNLSDAPSIDEGSNYSLALKCGLLFTFNNIERGPDIVNLNPIAMYDFEYNKNNWVFVIGAEVKVIFFSIGFKYEHPLSSVLNHDYINKLPLNLQNDSYLRGLNLSYSSISLTLGLFIDWKYRVKDKSNEGAKF